MNKFAQKGVKGFLKGHPVPKEIRKKIRKKALKQVRNGTRKGIFKKGHKTNLGKQFSKEDYPDYAMRNKLHNEKTKNLIKISNTGKHSKELNSNWKGGVTPLNQLLRVSSKHKIWRELIFIRDNFTCQNLNCPFCGNKMGGELHPHHIKSFSKYPKLRFRVDNGITLCADFHRNIRWKEKQYENILMEMLGEK